MKKEIIPIFFAVDDNYAPFLSVALKSIINKLNDNYQLDVYILNNGINNENIIKLKEYANENISLSFVDVSEKLNEIGITLPTRDYYSSAIYFRLFISELYPNLNKVLYLDADIILLEDISKLYNHNVDNKYLGVVTDDVVNNNNVFKEYAKEALGICPPKYFNSGILLMNLELMRKEQLYNKFIDLLSKIKFIIAPDQDYLNVLCKDKVLYLDEKWNKTPMFTEEDVTPYLIHFKLTSKPWHYDNVKFASYFWNIAKETSFYDTILNLKQNYNEKDILNDKKCEEKLIQLAISETYKNDTYKKIFLN